ncbi:hypothetical protein [Arthrobacter bambusae]|uniref:Uncharacterized protein n=1 Tax=Arthrobacter bambusae TaxID=1338426 RepID=A0AAW8D5T2_9MICC|nr:hypothetical protein [Arthrobacter bambusae]MDP9903233.1 hypothetical protein [Arthrobacter bambusae]MDQ0128773.1 hypothetical protein [Arthrobacter bambusae]MDQ0180114.1 hypothetical protein [Arthrobacter bambusae]
MTDNQIAADRLPPDSDNLTAWLEPQPEVELPPFEETPQGMREKEAQPGFTGTLRGYLDWINEMLMYGSIRVSEPQPHEWRKGLFREVSLVTGGYSTDEKLIGRIRTGLLSMFWESSHSGGLDIYLIREEQFANEAVQQWMRPDDGIFEEIHLVDEIAVFTGPSRDQSFTIKPELTKVVLSCDQRRDTSGNNATRRRLVIEVEQLDDETLRLFHRRRLREIGG